MEENLTLDIIIQQNIYNRELLKKVVNKEITVKQFKESCNKRYSFWQWGNKILHKVYVIRKFFVNIIVLIVI